MKNVYSWFGLLNQDEETLKRELAQAQSIWDWEEAWKIIKQLKELKNSPEKAKREQLEKELKEAQQSNNLDEAERIINELRKLSSPVKADKTTEDFDKKFDELKELLSKNGKIDKKDINKLKEFLNNDVRTYRNNVENNMSRFEKGKNDEIERLKNKLNWVLSEKDTNVWGVLREHFSPERKRLVELKDTFIKFKNDTKEYPKNVLLYASTYSKWLLWQTKQYVKRSRGKRFKKLDPKSLWQEIKKLEVDLQPKDKDTEQRLLTKQIVLEEVMNAKKHYIRQAQRDIWLAA